jgi:hypothetical protein
MSNFTDYASGGGGSAGTGGASSGAVASEYWSLAKKKKAYLDYLGNKRDEIDEQQDARRYRHGAHWTADQIKAEPAQAAGRHLQPHRPQDRRHCRAGGEAAPGPEGIPAHAEARAGRRGRDLRAQLRARPAGLEGQEPDLRRDRRGRRHRRHRDQPGPDRGAERLRGRVRLRRPGRVLLRPALVPARFLRRAVHGCWQVGGRRHREGDVPRQGGRDRRRARLRGDLSSNSDRDNKWFAAHGEVKRLRIVDIWYKHKGEWCYGIFTGSPS